MGARARGRASGATPESGPQSGDGTGSRPCQRATSSRPVKGGTGSRPGHARIEGTWIRRRGPGTRLAAALILRDRAKGRARSAAGAAAAAALLELLAGTYQVRRGTAGLPSEVGHSWRRLALPFRKRSLQQTRAERISSVLRSLALLLSPGCVFACPLSTDPRAQLGHSTAHRSSSQISLQDAQNALRMSNMRKLRFMTMGRQ